MLMLSRRMAALACVVLASTEVAAQPPSAINIPFERYTLPNGLTVILSPRPKDGAGTLVGTDRVLLTAAQRPRLVRVARLSAGFSC